MIAGSTIARGSSIIFIGTGCSSSSSRVRTMEQDGNSCPVDAEILKAVFPLLEGQDLARCLCVCKRWKDVASDDYFWKNVCAKRWPSVLCNVNGAVSSSSSSGPGGLNSSKKETMISTVESSRSYFNLFSRFSKTSRKQPVVLPKLRFEDLEFYVDIWWDGRPLYSKVVPGPSVLSRILDPPAAISQGLRQHLESECYKLTVPVSPRFAVQFSDNPILPKISMLLRRRDDQRMACILDMASFDYRDGDGNVAHAFQFLRFSPLYPFVAPIRAWAALLYIGSEQDQEEVFGIELDFVDVANNEREVLCLLEILDWKSIE